MVGEFARKGTKRSGEARSLVSNPPWNGIALAAILLLSAFLNLYGLTSEGHPNSYYSAAVKNMLMSWSNFFFVSFDAGFVSVDKPPLGLWSQALAAWLLGFNALTLVLPQAIASVLSVALLHHLVRRAFGPLAGLLSALALSVTPIIVATSRNNTMDMLVVLLVLLAAWAFVVAAERGSLSLLLLSAALVGLGFNAKTLQAFLVLPALYLLYLLAARASWRRRFVHLGVATVMLLAVSLSWALAVDVTPSDQRPYVGGSEGDSALNVAFGYNGLERLLGRSDGPGGPPPGGDGKAAEKSSDAKGGDRGGAPKGGPGGGGGPGGVGENGEPGPLRLLWISEEARVHPSAYKLMEGYTFVGPNAVIGRGASLSGTVAIGNDCRVSNGATVKQSVLLPGSSVGSGAYLEDCIVGPSYEVPPGEWIRGGALVRGAS